jgi:hypothetical protein
MLDPIQSVMDALGNIPEGIGSLRLSLPHYTLDLSSAGLALPVYGHNFKYRRVLQCR